MKAHRLVEHPRREAAVGQEPSLGVDQGTAALQTGSIRIEIANANRPSGRTSRKRAALTLWPVVLSADTPPSGNPQTTSSQATTNGAHARTKKETPCSDMGPTILVSPHRLRASRAIPRLAHSLLLPAAPAPHDRP